MRDLGFGVLSLEEEPPVEGLECYIDSAPTLHPPQSNNHQKCDRRLARVRRRKPVGNYWVRYLHSHCRLGEEAGRSANEKDIR